VRTLEPHFSGGQVSLSDQLLIPDPAKRDSKSFELVRVWVANKGQHVSLRPGVWKDPAAWGIMLADLARHVANAYQQDSGLDGQEVLRRISAALVAELGMPTDKPSGIIHRT
jgi:hypothetical protein